MRRWPPALVLVARSGCGVHIDRLRKSRDIRRVYQRGAGRSSVFVRLKVLARPADEGASRAAVVVSGKVGKAVRRNRVRRRLREILRLECEPCGRAVDLVITALPGSAEAAFEDLRDSMRQVLRRAGLLRARGER